MKYLIPLIALCFISCGQRPQSSAPVLAENSPHADGQRIYMRRCATCHQNDGSGKLRGHEFAANFTAPDGVLTRTDDELRNSILNGYEGRYGRMPAFRPILNDKEVDSIIGYIRFAFGEAKPAEQPAAPVE